jgi:DNA-binding LytR/AlgR family response regulator
MTTTDPYSCIIIDDDPVARAVIQQFISEVAGLDLVAFYESAADAVLDGAMSSARILFLDVEMPKMTGLELLDTMSDPPLVVLVTSKTDYAVDAFGFEVVDYLVKPVTFQRFMRAVNRCKSILESQIDSGNTPGHVFVKSEGKLLKLVLKEIEWIEAKGDYVLIHTPKQDYFIHNTMKRLSERLGTAEFVRVHRSFIVRLDQISDIQDGSIRIGKKVIPVGASYEDALLKRLTML